MTAALRNVAFTALLAIVSAVTSGAFSPSDTTALQPYGTLSDPDRGQLAAAHIDESRVSGAAARLHDERIEWRDEPCCATRPQDERQAQAR